MSGPDATALYQALVVEHGNAPRRLGPLPGATHQARLTNPLCGDRVTLRLRVVEEVVAALRFEAGTPDIVGVIGLGAAIEWFLALGPAAVAAHDAELLAHATEVLAQVPGLRVIGTARERIGLVSFILEGLHPHDVGTALDLEGIAIRTGHHCAQPLMQRFGLPATARASLGLYNTRAEIDALATGLEKVRRMFA